LLAEEVRIPRLVGENVVQEVGDGGEPARRHGPLAEVAAERRIVVGGGERHDVSKKLDGVV
jgi:hypothetical protein